MLQVLRAALVGAVVSFALLVAPAQAQNLNLAPGFSHLSKGAKLVLLPVDAELFALSAGGVTEPKADWTKAAIGHMQDALRSRAKNWGLEIHTMSEAEADAHAEQVALHAAVADSIALHHSLGGMWKLPSKDGKLDWSFGDAMKDIGVAHQARYGLFMWVRDSYATAERKAAMAVMAVLTMGNVVMSGGAQIGYASLVDLETGQVLWFNQLARNSGDLREAAAAAESIDSLLRGFPAAK